MTTVRDTLIAARAKVAQGWCQAAYARTSEGFDVLPTSVQAVSWCLIGALGGVPFLVVFDAIDRLRDTLGPIKLDTWNDAPGRTQADVLALYDRAIEAAP